MMSYNHEELPHYVRTAGKITLLTSIVGLLVFMFAFMVDVGKQEFNHVLADYATTTLTVLNTPPAFTLNPYEVVESSTSSPTNSGVVQQWSAIAEDANGADYFLLLCSTNASPTAVQNGPPVCGGGVQWGVSASTTSGALATVSTTTEEWGTGQFQEVNIWYAWVCDADPIDPRCVVTPEQGDYATSSSPFHINNRPTFSDFANDGPVDPAGTLVFHSTSSDDDSVGGEDYLLLVVCNSNTDYNATTNTCPNDFIASTTLTTLLSDAAATYTVPSIIRDDTYPAFGYIVDEHGHEALGNPINFDFIVNNVAPTVLGADITIYGVNGPGDPDLELTNEGGETSGNTLEFTIRDANSCVTAASSSEIVDFDVAVFRSSYGTTTCDGTSGSYNPNYCYPNGVPTTTWNLTCTQTSACPDDASQNYVDYSCTFPLWFVADPTDNAVNIPASFEADVWSVGIAGIDNDALTGSMATTTNPVELKSFAAIGILASQIAYGSIEPGSNNPNLSATSTAQNIGNTGLDQEVSGEAMCGTFSPSNTCPNSATSTVPDWRQQFSTTTYAYDTDALEDGTNLDPRILQLASTSPGQELELDVLKTTSTSTPQEGTTYWGIAVPASITLAGSYTGLNTFVAKTAEAIDWGTP